MLLCNCLFRKKVNTTYTYSNNEISENHQYIVLSHNTFMNFLESKTATMLNIYCSHIKDEKNSWEYEILSFKKSEYTGPLNK